MRVNESEGGSSWSSSTVWTLDHVVRTLMEYYDTTDSETKRLVPLKRVYWPA